MDKFILKYKRKIIQITTLILYNLNFKGFKDGYIYRGDLKKVCVPGLNCYSCPGAIFSCPIGALQTMFTGKKNGFSIIDRIPFYALGILIFFAIMFGRIICGFLCPFGLFQELVYKIKSKKICKNKITSKLIYIKYFVLVVFVLLLSIIFMKPMFCKLICPVGTLEGGLYFFIFDKNIRDIAKILFDFKVIIFILIMIMSIFIYRFFCRFICPLGAFYGLFNKISIFGIKVDKSKCNNCNVCVKTCLMDVKKVGDSECIMCGECIEKCKNNAIHY